MQINAREQKRKLIHWFVHCDCARDYNCNFCVKVGLIRNALLYLCHNIKTIKYIILIIF
jgi:hypothetical protein